MRTLDKLLEDPRAIVAKLVHADPQSFVPVAYQNLGDFVLNDSGVHYLFPDADGELAVDTIYPVPFIATGGEGKVHVHLFTPSGDVESITLLDATTHEVFRSLSYEAKAKVEHYVCYCLLSGIQWEVST